MVGFLYFNYYEKYFVLSSIMKRKNLISLFRQFPGSNPLFNHKINNSNFIITDKDGNSKGDWLVCIDQKKINTDIPKIGEFISK